MDISRIKNVSPPDESPQGELRRTSARRTVVLGGLIAVLLALNSGAPPLLPRLCVWYNLTGTDCPFCGLTRSAVASGDLNFARAIELHPLGPVVLGALIIWLAVSVLRWTAGMPPALPRRVQRAAFIICGAAWLIWWLVVRIL